MTRNPLVNAVAASAYIIAVAFIMFYGTKHAPPSDSILAPIAVLSLFTLSAAVMAYVFGYQPVLMLLDSKKKEALELFLKTVGVFAAITFAILIIFFSGIFS